MNEQNRIKQIAFSKHVRNRRGLDANTKIFGQCRTKSGGGWWSLVARTVAKLCPELGINKPSFVVDHEEHITKVIDHAKHSTVGYCFTGCPEEGDTGYLIGLYRCESYKLCQRKQYHRTKKK